VLRVQGLTQELFGQTLRNIREVCDHRAILPGSYIISGGLSKVTANPHVVGEYADAWRGELFPEGDTNTPVNVFIKAVRIERAHKVGELFTVC